MVNQTVALSVRRCGLTELKRKPCNAPDLQTRPLDRIMFPSRSDAPLRQGGHSKIKLDQDLCLIWGSHNLSQTVTSWSLTTTWTNMGKPNWAVQNGGLANPNPLSLGPNPCVTQGKDSELPLNSPAKRSNGLFTLGN